MTAASILELVKARWPLVAGVGAVLAIAVAVFTTTGQSTPQPGRVAVPVAVAIAAQRDVPHMSEVAGTVESLHSVIIRPQVDGILTGVLFTEGDQVGEGQLLATIDDRSLQAALAGAKGELARAQATLRAAELNLARSQDLVQRGAVSRQVLDNQVADVDQLKAAVQVAQANVKTAEVNLSYTRIVSPVKGRVGIRRVDAGNFVRASDAQGLVTVAQVNPISVVFPVAQSVLADLRADAARTDGGMVEAFDRMSGDVLAVGRITAFDNTIDAATGTAKVRAEFDNANERLAPGQFVAVRMRTGLTPNAVVVPAVAVRPGLEGSYVFRIVDGVAERMPVQLGYTDDDVAVIAAGLTAGDKVVVDGMSRLTQGTAVSVREAAPQGPPRQNTSALPMGGLTGMQ